MIQTKPIAWTALCLCVAAPAGLAQALTLNLPATARTAASTNEALTSYLLPIAAFSQGQTHTRRIEGPVMQTAWQIDAPGLTTLQLLAPLRAQLVQAGFDLVFECEAADCGGFDFRYATQVLPEPDMHVDLGDYRFLSATKGYEAITLLVSRSSTTGFVQMTEVGGAVKEQPQLAAAASSPPGQVALSHPADTVIDSAAAPSDLGASLMAGAAVAMDDLVFASGASALSEGVYPSLVALADLLTANPGMQVALVGHTDASGSLEVNIAVSRKRAESVRQRLIQRYKIPARQVAAEGVGYLSPRAPNLSEAGRERNRRVEVMMTTTQ